jgi:hypothetical protein
MKAALSSGHTKTRENQKRQKFAAIVDKAAMAAKAGGQVFRNMRRCDPGETDCSLKT